MLPPPNLQKKCAGFSSSFSLRHKLIFSNGGLVITHHNKVHYKLLQLFRQVLHSLCVCSKPLIHRGHRRSEEEVRQGRGVLETRCDVLIQGLLESHTDTIIDLAFLDSDSKTCNHEPMDKLLDCWEKKKR